MTREHQQGRTCGQQQQQQQQRQSRQTRAGPSTHRDAPPALDTHLLPRPVQLQHHHTHQQQHQQNQNRPPAKDGYQTQVHGNSAATNQQARFQRQAEIQPAQRVQPSSRVPVSGRGREQHITSNELHEAVSLSNVFEEDEGDTMHGPQHGREAEVGRHGDRSDLSRRQYRTEPDNDHDEEHDHGYDAAYEETFGREALSRDESFMTALTEEESGILDEMEVDVKPVEKVIRSERAGDGSGSTGLSIASGEGFADFGLSELARMDRQIVPKGAIVKEKTLCELVEPLIDQMTQLYADEWEDIISTEEQVYNETARGIGQVIDEGLVNIATKLGRSMQQTCEANEAVKMAIRDETLAAHGRMAELMVDQKRLQEKLKDNFERCANRDSKIVADLTAIRAKSKAELETLDAEWNRSTDGVDRRAKTLSEGGLQHDFNNYLMKNMSLGGLGTEVKKSKSKRSSGKA